MDVGVYEQIVDFIRQFNGRDRDCILELSKIHPTIEKTILGSIYSLIVQRKTTRNFYKVKNNIKTIYNSTIKQLNNDNSSGIIQKLAKQHAIQPNAMARIILEHHLAVASSLGKKKPLYAVLQDTTLINDKYLSQEIFKCNIVDCVYGPMTDLIKNCIGKESEITLEKLLSQAGIHYKTENELRAKGYDKTPDILLEIPVAVDGNIIHWVESKALFADLKNHKQYANDQYLSYFNRFGPGLVIYWYGYLESILDLDEYRNKFIVKDHFPNMIMYNPDEITVDG